MIPMQLLPGWSNAGPNANDLFKAPMAEPFFCATQIPVRNSCKSENEKLKMRNSLFSWMGMNREKHEVGVKQVAMHR